MMPMLHDTNEEADLQLYRTYVRSLSYDDLRDIRAHLDEDQFPARYDVLRREMQSRRVREGNIAASTLNIYRG